MVDYAVGISGHQWGGKSALNCNKGGLSLHI